MEELNRICEELARIAKALGADEPEIEREAERRLQEQANREAFIRSSRARMETRLSDRSTAFFRLWILR